MLFDHEQPAYKSLRAIVTERTSKVVAWTGAGLSQPAGLPNWSELRKHLTAEARAQIRAQQGESQAQRMAEVAALERIESHWTVFERLQRIMGDPIFSAQIRSALAKADDAAVPEGYRQLWRLKSSLRGIITLNLDRFAARAFAEVTPGQVLHEINGGALAGDYGAVLQSNVPMVLNAHGVLASRPSWVFTSGDLNRLLADESYNLFINSLTTSNVVLFIGVSADDVASGGFLARQLQSRFSGGQHFWLTSRTDEDTRAWTSAAGIQPIYYVASPDHETPIRQFFDDLISYIPKDTEAPPVQHSGAPFPASAPDIRSQDPNQIRIALAGLIDTTIGLPNRAEAIATILQAHDLAVHQSWFIRTDPPHNQFFTYTLEDLIGEGGFGRVYRAKTGSNERVAVKVIKQDIIGNPDLLGSFRRGVRSMKILSERNVIGMVPYLEAFELPPSVVMELIDGPNLQQLKEQGGISSLEQVLTIANKIADIVNQGHMLPERVLHRDLRPANAMVKDYYHTGGIDNIVVLDFDLSWHKGSMERSVELGAVATMGYLAPELLNRTAGVSTRNTAVDVYGLAMTIYYMISGQHPKIGSTASGDWHEVVLDSVEKFTGSIEWRSLPARISRLILSSTRQQQALRPDMPQMKSELARLRVAALAPKSVRSAELIAEELAARAGGWREYQWSDDLQQVIFRLSSGVTMTLRPNEVNGEIGLVAQHTETGQSERRHVFKYISERRSEVVAKLRSVGWTKIVDNMDGASFGIESTIAATHVLRNMDAVSASLKEIIHRISLE